MGVRARALGRRRGGRGIGRNPPLPLRPCSHRCARGRRCRRRARPWGEGGWGGRRSAAGQRSARSRAARRRRRPRSAWHARAIARARRPPLAPLSRAAASAAAAAARLGAPRGAAIARAHLGGEDSLSDMAGGRGGRAREGKGVPHARAGAAGRRPLPAARPPQVRLPVPPAAPPARLALVAGYGGRRRGPWPMAAASRRRPPIPRRPRPPTPAPPSASAHCARARASARARPPASRMSLSAVTHRLPLPTARLTPRPLTDGTP